MGIKWVQNFLRHYIEKRVSGPSYEMRKRCKSYVWGQVKNEQGDSYTLKLTTQEGYSFTAESAVLAVEELLKNKVRVGGWTPSQAFGKNFVCKVPKTFIAEIE